MNAGPKNSIFGLRIFSVWGLHCPPNAGTNQRIQFKFEPNWSINGSVKGNSIFEPLYFPSFWKLLNINLCHFIRRVQFKFEPNWLIKGSNIANQSFDLPSCLPFWKFLICGFRHFKLRQ